MNYEPLLQQVETFVTKYMRKHDNPKLVYHNLINTQNIVQIANKIAEHNPLTEDQLFIVRAAAWFLYVGYYKDVSNPQEAGSQLAEESLKNFNVESETIQSIKKCVLSPAFDSQPDTLSESIIRDADSFYLGTENFSTYNKLRRKEYVRLNKIAVDKDEWNRRTIQMLESHQYFTDYCKNMLGQSKQRNLERLRKKNPLMSLAMSSLDPPENKISKEEKKAKQNDKARPDKKDSAERTIETMFRTSTANSQRLSSQADTKAHIMISVNTIIISLMLGLRQLAQSSKLTIPVVVLLLVNLATIIFSILATRPNVAKRRFTENDFEANKVNLLFFGNFFSMDFDNYSKAMLHIMDDKHALYITMLRNLYEQGAVLAKKYKMLKISYNVFMYGLVLSVILFFVAPKLF